MEELIELAVLALFVFSVAGVLGRCCQLLGRASKEGLKNLKFTRFDRLILLTGAIGIICIAYGFVEPFGLETTYVTVPTKKLPHGTRIRIAHISDLHCDGFQRAEKKLVKAIAEAKPDLIFFTGDAANNKKGLVTFKKTMTELSKIAPVYACDGNHDTRSGSNPEARYGGTGAHLLNCSAVVAFVKGQLIWVGGVSIDNETCMEKTLGNSPPDSFKAFLYHFPEGIKQAAAHKIDLYCAGHTHGGQIRLPFYGAIVTASASGKQYEWGSYKVGDTSMYVNRGIGMTGLPVRFLAPPELTIIDVDSDASSSDAK